MTATGKSLVVLLYCTFGVIFSFVGVKYSYGAGAAFFTTGIGVAIAIGGSVLHLASMKYFAGSVLSHLIKFLLIVVFVLGIFWLLFRLGIFDFT